MRTVRAAATIAILICASAAAARHRSVRRLFIPAAPDDCSLRFRGRVRSRKPVKLRTAADGAAYTKVNHGEPITVAEWLKMTCALDRQVPRSVPLRLPIAGVETQTVTLKGYLVAAKLSPQDNDIHAEMAGSPAWDDPHVVIEVPPGDAYCSARKTLWGLVKRELPSNSSSTVHVMNSPPPITVTGYVFLDTAHGKTDFCHTSGGRGIKRNGVQAVQGLWEVHPVLSVREP
jgi:hypothetical protein